MLVSQYIFTACGKRKNGDFVVWAKSPDITHDEGEEIHELMGYKNPQGVNLYEASEEQIREACPTKYAYFILSTGKRVLAESNFIGRVYSDEDKRWGNFFIHAYVFDEQKDLFPMSFLGKNKFKSKLEYSEWHDEPCPETLPQVELQPEQLNLRELNEFLTPERKKLFLSLLQSVIRAVDGGPMVAFNDTEENQKRWYSLIGILLPPSLREKATFASQMIPLYSSAAATGKPSAKALTMCNIANGVGASVFNYAANAAMKKPVFDFRNNIFVEVNFGSYVSELEKALDKSLISALEYAKDIENLCNSYGCDIEQAVALYMLKYGKVQWFSDFGAFASTVEAAEKSGMFTAKDAADNIYRAVFVNKQWQQETLALPMLKKIYDLSDGQNVKNDLISYYFAHLSDYGVHSSDASAYVDEFYASAPFDKKDCLQYLYANNAISAGFAQANDFCRNYLIFKTILSEYPKLKADFSHPIIAEIFALYIKKRAYAEIDLILSQAYSANRSLAEGLVRDSVYNLIDPVSDSALLFHLIEKVDSGALQLELLKRIISANINSPSFIDTYIVNFNKNNQLYSRLESELVRDPNFRDVGIMRETYAFRVNNNVNRNDLNNYFKKYYLGGVDRGLYFEKLKQYLNQKPDAKFAFEIYSDIRTVDINFADMRNILLQLQSVMYAAPENEILKYSGQEAAIVDDLDAKLASCGYGRPQKGVYVNFVRALSNAEKDGNVAAQFIRYAHERDVFENFTEEQTEKFTKDFLGKVLGIYVDYRLTQGNNDPDYNACVLFNIMYRLISTRSFSEMFAKVTSKMNAKGYIVLLTDMFVFAANYSGACVAGMQKFLKKYLDGFSAKKADKLISEILNETPECFKMRVEAFAESIGYSKKSTGHDGAEKKKGGFFSHIFGFKKDKDNK